MGCALTFVSRRVQVVSPSLFQASEDASSPVHPCCNHTTAFTSFCISGTEIYFYFNKAYSEGLTEGTLPCYLSRNLTFILALSHPQATPEKEDGLHAAGYPSMVDT